MIDDPETLRGLITSLGGTVIPGATFRFDLPLSEVREVAPKIRSAAGLGIRQISQRRDDDPQHPNQVCTITTLELYRPDTEQGRLPEGY